MCQDILRVTTPVTEFAEHRKHVLAERADAGPLRRLLADIGQIIVVFLRDLGNDFLDSRGVNPAILDES